MDSRINLVSVSKLTRRAARARTRLASDLGQAIANRDIVVHFQPQFDLRSGSACGVEALARWMMNGKFMPPAIFIPIAERYGLINAVGVSVLYQACTRFVDWHLEGLTLSVNLSVRQINEDFATLVADILRLTGVRPSCLELEVTESAVMANPEQAILALNRCKAIGVQLALDDFGTGYSSLNHLAQLPIDRLKLDQSFVRRMITSHKTAAIVRSVLAMGRDLDVVVIAEGIETEQELAMLEAMGCTQGQGNLLSSAQPADSTFQILQRPWGSRYAGMTAGLADNGDLHAA